MKFTKPTIISTSVIAASTLVLGGVAFANTSKADTASPTPSATSSTDGGRGGMGRHGGAQREALTGDAKAKAEDAAKAKVPGGTVTGSFQTPFGSVVEMKAADGSTVRVMLNANAEVLQLRQVWKEMPRPQGGRGMHDGHGKHGGGKGMRGGPGGDQQGPGGRGPGAAGPGAPSTTPAS